MRRATTVATLMIASLVVTLAFLRVRDNMPHGRFARLKPGMTEAEVQTIMHDRPPRLLYMPNQVVLAWRLSETEVAWVSFERLDDNGYKYPQPMAQPVLGVMTAKKVALLKDLAVLHDPEEMRMMSLPYGLDQVASWFEPR